MVAKRRLLALVLIGSGIASAACSLITDVDRSKIEASGGSSELGGTSSNDSGTSTGTGGLTASGGSSSHDAGNKPDAANSDDASDPE